MGARLITVMASVLLLAGCSSPSTTSDETQAASAFTTPSQVQASTPTPATPNYSIVGTTAKRYDLKPIHYVVVDPVDVSNDAFKQNIKLVLQAVADKVGGPDFSARVFDDEGIGTETYSYDSGSESYLDLPPEEGKAFEDRKGQHLVAMYTGGLDTTLTPYAIDWYPGTDTSAPNVGQWVSNEDWKPQ